MECAVNRSIREYATRKEGVDTIIRYIKLKYGISMDAQAIAKRLKAISAGYDFSH